MTKLFLTSAGLVPETYPGFLKLLGKDPEGSRLVYVPTASDLEPDKSYADEDTKRLSDIGFLAKNIDLKDKSEELLNKELSDADIVYVQGGNTFYLLDWVRKSGFDKAIKNFWEGEDCISASAPDQWSPESILRPRAGNMPTGIS
jgi:Peptidase E